ncbi:hypothetical protein BBF96_02140 [Anoxybacter fermentans]|uniref:Flavoprotein domain-containing protein n=1 Tax=Anoxybacter fermentans TaxID=1323375 RepID=A0A3S9SVJ3_9FIRM|nr:hypothetical protein [Anoxybacter fermentans]AZR72298.1 hypothetical protein BBF96_02140 [Anoxybacter fermentans]
MEMEERQLIELVVREVLKQIKLAGVEINTRKLEPLPLVVLSGSCSGLSYVQDILDFLQSLNQEFRIFLGETDLQESELPAALRYRVVKGEGEAELDQILSESSIICLPWIPLAVLSRMVHLEPECSVSLLLTKALIKGVSVRARKIFVQPVLDFYQSQDLSPIIRRIQSLIREGKIMGMEWMTDRGLKHLFASIPFKPNGPVKKGVLTAVDVRKMKDQREIVVPEGTIITPLARDEMKRYGLQLRMV